MLQAWSSCFKVWDTFEALLISIRKKLISELRVKRYHQHSTVFQDGLPKKCVEVEVRINEHTFVAILLHVVLFLQNNSSSYCLPLWRECEDLGTCWESAGPCNVDQNEANTGDSHFYSGALLIVLFCHGRLIVEHACSLLRLMNHSKRLMNHSLVPACRVFYGEECCR